MLPEVFEHFRNFPYNLHDIHFQINNIEKPSSQESQTYIILLEMVSVKIWVLDLHSLKTQSQFTYGNHLEFYHLRFNHIEFSQNASLGLT